LCEFSAEFWELIAVQFFYFVCSNAWKWVLNFRCDKYGVYLPTFWYINRTQNKDFLLCPLCNKNLTISTKLLLFTVTVFKQKWVLQAKTFCIWKTSISPRHHRLVILFLSLLTAVFFFPLKQKRRMCLYMCVRSLYFVFVIKILDQRSPQLMKSP
jgi:hypothetical protein